MISFDKEEIRNSLTVEDIYSVLQEFGAEPEYTHFGLLAATICHNKPGEGSKKLYFYLNTNLFQCYSNCGSFDIFELVRSVMRIQHGESYDLNQAVRWVARRFNILGEYQPEEEDGLEDWKYLDNYKRIQDIDHERPSVVLKEYDKKILSCFNYNVVIEPWLLEDININVMRESLIGYYPGGEQITIPHFDIEGRLVGVRGRTLSKEEGEMYGKYRPLRISRQLYNHPLGFNLYNLNQSKKNITLFKKAVIFESEKSCLKMRSYYGTDADISVACCGSSLSAYQVQLLLSLGVEEIVVAFDKQYEELNTDESKKWAKKLTQIHEKYKNNVLVSFLWDKEDLLGYKSSPIDEGMDKFWHLFKERINL